MIAADTNIILRLILQDDPQQVTLAETYLSNKGLWVSHAVILETAWVLQSYYAFERDNLLLALENLPKMSGIVVQDPQTVLGALEIFRANKKIQFADALILAIAKAQGHTPLITFDNDLSKVVGATAP